MPSNRAELAEPKSGGSADGTRASSNERGRRSRREAGWGNEAGSERDPGRSIDRSARDGGPASRRSVRRAVSPGQHVARASGGGTRGRVTNARHERAREHGTHARTRARAAARADAEAHGAATTRPVLVSATGVIVSRSVIVRRSGAGHCSLRIIHTGVMAGRSVFVIGTDRTRRHHWRIEDHGTGERMERRGGKDEECDEDERQRDVQEASSPRHRQCSRPGHLHALRTLRTSPSLESSPTQGPNRGPLSEYTKRYRASDDTTHRSIPADTPFFSHAEPVIGDASSLFDSSLRPPTIGRLLGSPGALYRAAGSMGAVTDEERSDALRFPDTVALHAVRARFTSCLTSRTRRHPRSASDAASSPTFEILDQALHLVDLAPLRIDDLVGELSHARVGDACPLAREDRNLMVRDHRLHPVDVIDGSLAADEPEGDGEHHDRADEDRDVAAAVRLSMRASAAFGRVFS